jgi:hypothetical protein
MGRVESALPIPLDYNGRFESGVTVAIQVAAILYAGTGLTVPKRPAGASEPETQNASTGKGMASSVAGLARTTSNHGDESRFRNTECSPQLQLIKGTAAGERSPCPRPG